MQLPETPTPRTMRRTAIVGARRRGFTAGWSRSVHWDVKERIDPYFRFPYDLYGSLFNLTLMSLRNPIWIFIALLWGLTGPIQAREDLPYPEGPLTADQIVEQVYTAAHGGLVRNAVSKRNKRAVALVVNRAPLELRRPGRKRGVCGTQQSPASGLVAALR